MGNVLRYIDENWNKPLSLKYLGNRFGINSRSIHNYFAGEGRSPTGTSGAFGSIKPVKNSSTPAKIR
jgi:transcriptional regulator GlxA family with amidase domain